MAFFRVSDVLTSSTFHIHKGGYIGNNSKRGTICLDSKGLEATKKASQARSETDASNRGSEEESQKSAEETV